MNAIDPLIQAEAQVLQSLHPKLAFLIGLLAQGASEKAILLRAQTQAGATPLILGLMASYMQTKRKP